MVSDDELWPETRCTSSCALDARVGDDWRLPSDPRIDRPLFNGDPEGLSVIESLARGSFDPIV